MEEKVGKKEKRLCEKLKTERVASLFPLSSPQQFLYCVSVSDIQRHVTFTYDGTQASSRQIPVVMSVF